MPVGVIALDTEGMVRTCNKSAGQIMNIEPDEVLGRNHASFFPEKLIHILPQAGLKENGKNVEVEIGAEGNQRVLDIEKVPLGNGHGYRDGVMLLIQDLTLQKKLEQELRRNERHAALGKVAAGVAHELRNPLSSIKGLALLLRNKLKEDNSSREAAEVMISEVERLDRSIGELLDYARPESMEKQNVELIEVIEKAMLLIASDAKEGGVEISEKYQEGACLVQGDADRLTQVFLNLFLNSIQAMPKGGTLEVCVDTTEDKVIVKVVDSGVGMEQDTLEKIFDPYYTTKNQGTGLGLSITAKIIEEHEGRIEFKSQKGRGTEAKLIFPA